MLRKLVLGVAALALTTGPLAAQGFRVGPRLGFITYDDDTGLESGALIGLDGMYRLSPNLGIGFMLDVSRPSTDSSFFPAEMSFGDTTFIFGVKQPLTVVRAAVAGEFRLGGNLSPFISGSIGAYRISLDPQAARGPITFTELGLSIGGGLEFSTSDQTSVRLEIHDFVFTNFDRSRLDVTRRTGTVSTRTTTQGFNPVRFPDVLPALEPFDGTAHNISFAVAFSFTPGGS